MTPPTVDVEITSKTTARATLEDANVPPMELEATEHKEIGAVVHEFVHTIAKEQDAAVDVVYRTGKDTKYLTVGPNGQADMRAPSTPIPVVTMAEPEPAESEPVSAPPVGSVTVSAESMDYADTTPAAQPVARPIVPTPTPPQTAGRLAAAPSPSPAGQRPAEAITGPITGPLDVLSQLSAPRATPVSADRARLGVRGRINALLGLKLAPKTDSLEMRLRGSQLAITRPLPEGAVITVANVKGGVGKTPMSISLAETLAEHRGPATITCLDLGEVGGSLGDRIAQPASAGQNIAALLAATDVRPSTLSRYLARQPFGSDVVTGAAVPVSFDQAAALAATLGRHRELIVADTGNSSLAGSWQWAATAATAVIVPVPLRRDAAAGAQCTLNALVAARPDVLSRTVVVITEGPGDAPLVETETVEAFVALGVPVCRMPFEPLFASGERIALTQLRRETRDALTVLAATVVDRMAVAVG
ncbi:hypothetical protein [Rhodococcus triatomae]|nr:hypothetical protein G419_14214 [Rhodococcus triatomae BKS 15-14]